MAVVPLPPAEYYRLRYLHAASEREAYRAEVLALRAARGAQQAAAVFADALSAAATAHGFDARVAQTWRDEDTSLVSDTPPSCPPIEPLL